MASSEESNNTTRAMELIHLKTSNDQKEIIINKLEERNDELKQDKTELKREKLQLQEANTILNRQMHEMRDRHAGEINKLHERMLHNLSGTCGDAKV